MENKIIQLIKEDRENYLHHANIEKESVKRHFNEMTAQQIQRSMVYIQDMESRAYAMMLLLEEIEDNE